MRAMRFVLLALVALVLGGCSGAQPVSEVPFRAISFHCPGFEDLCIASIGEWNKALETSRTVLVYASSGPADYVVHKVGAKKDPCGPAEAKIWVGCTRGGSIELDPIFWTGTANPRDYAMGVMLHEMGHAIGLPDGAEDGPDGVMYPVMRKRKTIDEATASYVKHL